MNPTSREAIFISHASPEDNAFTRWLGAKLAALGYEVWADVMRLHGGVDWARQLEDALRNRAAKMLLVANPAALDKQGVRNEIQIASEVARQLKDPQFIIPLRLAPYQAPFLIAQTQYIDFSRSWASGLAELLDTLATAYQLPRLTPKPLHAWHQAQSIGATQLIDRSEQLSSSWLRFLRLPHRINYFEPPVGFPLERFQTQELHRWPIVPHAAGLLTFATCDDQGYLAPEMPARAVAHCKVHNFLRDGWAEQHLDQFNARARFSDLVNQAFERLLQQRGLHPYAGSGGHHRWWGDLRTYPLDKVAFQWPQWKKGRRQIMGVSGKRGVHWHYAINAQARSSPIRHIRLYAGLIFTQNGMDALADAKKMHRLRRSFAKWRNPRWRDMLLAFLWWLGQGQREVALPISNSQLLRVGLEPLIFRSPRSVLQPGTSIPDEDDPDIDYEFGDDDIAEDDEGLTESDEATS